jgi:hypothetical protein
MVGIGHQKRSVYRAGLYAGWELEFCLPIISSFKTRLIENILWKLCTKDDSYSFAGTEAGICN